MNTSIKKVDWGLQSRSEKIVEGWKYVWWGYQIIGFMTTWYKKITAPENLRNDQKFWQKFPRKHIIKINTRTVREFRSIDKDKGFHGYYKLKKDDLVALLLEQSAEEMLPPAPRSKGKERRSVLPIKIIPSPQEMDEFEKEEMKKSRPVVKSRLSKLHKWLDDYVLKLIKNAIDRAFLRLKIAY